MDDILIARMAEELLANRRFSDLPATTRPMNTVWTALNNTLLALRLPIYHLYLGKPAPVPPAVSGTPIWSLPNDGDQEKLLLHPMAKWTGFDPQGPSAPGGRDALNDMARRFAARQTVSDDALAAATRA
jgi:hypothetical protein